MHVTVDFQLNELMEEIFGLSFDYSTIALNLSSRFVDSLLFSVCHAFLFTLKTDERQVGNFTLWLIEERLRGYLFHWGYPHTPHPHIMFK